MKAAKWVRRTLGVMLVVVLLAAYAVPAMAVGQSTTLAKKGACYIVAVHGVNIRSGPGMEYSILGVAKHGKKVYFDHVKNGWWYVTDGKGHYGWVDKQYLTTTNAVKKGNYVTKAKLNVRDYPKTSAKRITTLKKGAKVKLLYHNGDWAYIYSNGYYGYVACKYLKKK